MTESALYARLELSLHPALEQARSVGVVKGGRHLWSQKSDTPFFECLQRELNAGREKLHAEVCQRLHAMSKICVRACRSRASGKYMHICVPYTHFCAPRCSESSICECAHACACLCTCAHVQVWTYMYVCLTRNFVHHVVARAQFVSVRMHAHMCTCANTCTCMRILTN